MTWGMPVLTLAIWLALGWSSVDWVLRARQLTSPGTAMAASVTPPSIEGLAPGASPIGPEVGRLLGATPANAASPVAAAPSLASRLKLVGVASSGAQRGAALIGIDGQAPKPFRIGQAVIDGLLLQSVDRAGARLGAEMGGPPVLQLDMPLPRQP